MGKRIKATIDFEDKQIIVDKNLLSVEFGCLDRGNITDVVGWGIYANRGSLSFIDESGYFNNEKVNSLEIKNATVTLEFTGEKSTDAVSKFCISDCSFDEETKRVDISLVSQLYLWQNKYKNPNYAVPAIEKTIFIFSNVTISFILSVIEEDFGVSIRIGDDDKNIKNTTIYCTYFPYESLWDVMTKICQASMCRIIEDKFGNPIITGDRRNTRFDIALRPNNVIGYSNFGFVNTPNASISVTDREAKYEIIQSISKTINVAYDENGQPISTEGMTFSTNDKGNTVATIIFDINSPYKIFESGATVETIYYERTESDGRKAYYDAQYWKAAPIVVRFTNDNLRLVYSIEIIKRYSTYEDRVKSFKLEFMAAYFQDFSTKTLSKGDGIYPQITEIESNDLIQTNGYYTDSNGEKVSHGEHILNEVMRRYSNGIECLECECLLNDYYDVENDLAIDGSDFRTRLQIYDYVVPYKIKNDKMVPLRKTIDGKEKGFIIIGISYSYDGLLKQRLWLQEYPN